MVLDKRVEGRNFTMGKFKLRERVKSTPSALSPPPNPVKWAVKPSFQQTSSADTRTPRQSLTVPSTGVQTTPSDLDIVKGRGTKDCQQTPLSHHLHRANRLLNVNEDSDDAEWNIQGGYSSLDEF